MPFEKSAGAVVFYKENNSIKYLLLHYPSSAKAEKEYWDLPKGHIEKGEKELDTVKREVEEETGLKDFVFVEGFKEWIKYFFRHKDETIFKVVTFYLAETKTKDVKISSEHLGYKWLDYESAKEQLTHKNAKDVLKKANNFLLKNMTKCVLLFSGGLDSMLAAKILGNQEIKVIPVCFKSYFFDCQTAKKSAENLGLKLNIIDFSKEHLKVVKEPKFGRGQGMNPCLDCHLLMIKEAKKLMKKYQADFLATGEVLGERPLSQTRQALIKIEKEAELEGLILRPLSAKLLPQTIPEKRRLIERDKFLAISGRSRKPQLKLAKKFKIKEFPTPAGGCILTDFEYSKKLRQLFDKIPKANDKDCQLLGKGRVFWIDRFLIVIGRNEKENKEIKKLKNKSDIVLEPKNFPGPTVLLRGFGKRIRKEIIMKGAEFLLNYSKKLPEKIIISLNGTK